MLNIGFLPVKGFQLQRDISIIHFMPSLMS